MSYATTTIDESVLAASNTNATLTVIKRDGNLAPYTDDKIAAAITKAVLAVEGTSASGSARVKHSVDSIVKDMSSRFKKLYPSGASISIEDIQDQIELGLMRNNMQQIARAYVLYRDEHNHNRQQQ